MKSKLKWLLVLLLLPVMVNAEEANNDLELKENYYVEAGDIVNSSEDVNGSALLTGDNITFTNVAKGAGLLFGNNVTYNGQTDYGMIGGNVINLSGNVSNDLAVFGNSITFDKFTGGRDVFVFGNIVTINGNIDRNLVIYASTVVINDINSKNVKINAANIQIKNGNIEELSYNSDAEITIAKDVNINNKVLSENITEEQSFGDTAISYLLSYCNLLAIFVALALLTPQLFKKIDKQNENATPFSVLTTMGYGALALLVVPFACILLFTTVIGMSVAAGLLVLYIAAILMSTLLVGYLTGTIIWNKLIKKEQNILLAGLLGISIIYVLRLIPFVSTIVSFISIFLGIGIVLSLFKKAN